MRGGGQLERQGASAERLLRPRPGRVVKRVMAATVATLFALVGDARAPASAGDDVRRTPSPVAQSTAPASGAATPVYKPPTRGAPGGRMGGGTRGISGGTVVSVLTPDHVGLTSQAQPSLQWFLAQDVSSPLEITLIEPNRTPPLLEHRLAPPVRAGIHRLRLADHGVRLEPGVRYQWSVAVVTDPERRSRDLVAASVVERADVAEALRQQIGRASPEELPALYAEAGLWYDALTALSDRIEAAPRDRTLHRQRAALLQQVGLRDAADFDLRAVVD